MKSRSWFLYALVTAVFWGVWGALIELPEKAGFPATLGYCAWALTMVIPALIALHFANWKLDKTGKAIRSGLLVGITGAGGQLVLFQALRTGPAYLVFPLVSLSPLITIFFSMIILKEKASRRAVIGIIIALVAMPLLSYQPPAGGSQAGFLWIILCLVVFFVWGLQSFFLKLANTSMSAESIFFYMMIAGLGLIPLALLMTDFSQKINYGLRGPVLAAGVQMLNSIGALFLVYAFRYGKAIIVSPMINAGAPIITIVLSLILYGVFPHPLILAGLILGVIAIFLLAD